nr:hypothetical protein [Tanacetum cinerariifolium]
GWGFVVGLSGGGSGGCESGEDGLESGGEVVLQLAGKMVDRDEQATPRTTLMTKVIGIVVSLDT